MIACFYLYREINICSFHTHEDGGNLLHGIDFMSLEMSPGVENDFTARTLDIFGSVDLRTSYSQQRLFCQWFQHKGGLAWKGQVVI